MTRRSSSSGLSREATAAARAAAAASGAGAERARAAQERLAALERLAASRAEERLDALCGPSAGASRTSSPTRRADARVRRPRSTGSAPPASGSRCGASRPPRCASAFASSWPKLAAAAKRPGLSPAELEAAANEATAAARAAAHARDDLLGRASLAKERLAALERSLAEREGIPPAARALADEGAELALSLLDVDSGNERAVAAALAWRASAVMADDAAAGLALLQRAREAGLGSLAVLIGKRPAERVAELPVVPLDALLSATVASVTDEGFGFDPQRGELWFAGEAAEAVLLELESRRRELEQEVAELTGAGAGWPSARLPRRQREPRRPRLPTPRSPISVLHARPIRPCCSGSPPAPTGSTKH